MDTSTYDLQLTTIQAHVKQTCCCYLPFIPLLFLALGSKVMSGSMNTGEFVHNRINVGMNDAYGSQSSLRCNCWDFWASLVAQLVKNLPAMQETPVAKIHWKRDRLPTPVFLGFPGGSAGKESACSVGDLGSIPGLGRFPAEGNSYPLQYSSLENSKDCRAHGVTKNRWDFCPGPLDGMVVEQISSKNVPMQKTLRSFGIMSC